MDSFEQKIADCVNEKLNDGTVERLIEEKLEKGVSDAISEAFGYGGAAKKLLVSKIEEVMVPVIEKHDFNQYLIKLDSVLTELVNNTSLVDNKVILDNFRRLMKPPVEDFKHFPLSNIYEAYQDYVSKNIDTDNLEVCTDDEPSYYDATTNMEITERERRWFSSIGDEKIIKFTCDEDENMNCELRLEKSSRDDTYRVDANSVNLDIHSLKNLSEFEILIQQLKRAYAKIEIDMGDSSGDCVEIEATPEASFS